MSDDLSISDDFSIPSSFDGKVRLFPLPNVVLFPRALLPLHIFEPRYRQMTADALATDRLITMALLKPGAEGEREERPALHPIAGLGKIIADQRLDDGRYGILLRGCSRICILNELNDDKLYRTAQVELLHDTGSLPPEQARMHREELHQLLSGWLPALGGFAEPLAKLLDSDLPLSTFVDILGFMIPFDIAFKQELLQELDVGKRAQRLLHHLQTEGAPKGMLSLHNFPPDFSPN